MAADFHLTREASRDAEAAYAWYESKRDGLGEQFLDSLDACVERICKDPEWFPVVHRHYRRALLRRFPYAIFFELSDGAIIIAAILHTAREPQKWRQRLPE